MRVLVLGGGGFIGRHVVAALLAAGHEVTVVVRKAGDLAGAFAEARIVELDLALATDAARWLPLLAGVECVVNLAGVLRGVDMAAVHVAMPRALYEAAGEQRVRRVILVSAISARADVRTDYATSKLAGEAVLRESGLEWTILRPSLVYGEGSYGATSLLRGLAALPGIVPLPGNGDHAFTPIHADDLAADIVRICEDPGFARRVLEPVGPRTLDLATLLVTYRSWLGFGKARLVRVPMPLMHLLGRLGDWFGRGPIASNSLRQMMAGNSGDSAAYAAAIGRMPRDLLAALRDHPAQVQDRWHARLFFLAPAIRVVLIVLWLASAWVGLLGGKAMTMQFVSSAGIPAAATRPLQIGSSLLDLAMAALVALDRRGRLAAVAQFAVVAGYTLVIGAILPALWLDPLGPLLKNLPVLALIAVHGAIGDSR